MDTFKKLDTSNALELHERRGTMYDEGDKYRRSFVDESTGLIEAKYVESRVCPVCGGNHFGQLLVKNGGSYVLCSDCGMVYLNPVFKDVWLRQYYEFNNSNQSGAHDDEQEFYSNIYDYGLDLIANFKVSGKLIDIGCSGGFFLGRAANRGFFVEGLELNNSEVRIAQSKGFHVFEGTIDELVGDSRYDVVCMWDVFEHIKDGGAYLSKLRFLLAEGGVIFLQIPNSGSLAARVMREECNMFDGIEHVNLYSSKTIKELADSVGLRVLKIRSVIDELKPLDNYLAYKNPYKGDFSESIISELIDPKELHRNMFGYKLQVVLGE